ncbi:UTRA domain-containing protein [Actinacidiphila epipremni]|uniref:UTRA domain-containing protein n=1 Tax=Actinacidiphila epipremni TaxID=2053013 RepID=A0ABX0ZQG9_9ACTN|nr:UTRA domain-containing protein [Actinacidiphila epipremni]NJP46174.1 UTRA domain-containing protein [Actinacidiphila epipremni]
MSSGEWTSTALPYVVPRRAGERDAWAEEAGRRGRRGTQRVTYAGEVAAPEEVAAGLRVRGGEVVVVRRRVMLLDGAPVELTDTYYPADIARGTRLAGTARIPGGAVTLLASMGHAPRHVREEVHARLAGPEERAALELAEGAPVLCLTRVTADTTRPFQVDLSVFPATGQRLRYDMRID